jgi:hypothetical protein
MLLFSSDTFTVNGITVFPDHADPNQFWYLPGPVGLETEQGSSEPQFLMTLYTPDVATAGIQGSGFLNLTLALKVDDMTQSTIIGKIRTLFPNADNPHLAPVPFDDGTVQIVALDLQGSGGTSNTAPGTGQAIEHILGASSPELFGNNDALFALTLSEEGATILEQAFQDGATPVGGIYNLKFTGVLPALDIKITADMKRVYESFSVGLAAQVYFVSAGIDATFEKLVQDQVIKMEIVNLATDGSTATQETWALNLFKDQVLTQLFTPSLSPTTEAAADAQSVNTNPKSGGTQGSQGSQGTQGTQGTQRTQTMGSGGTSSSGMTTPSSNQGSQGMRSSASTQAPSGIAPATNPSAGASTASGSASSATAPATGATPAGTSTSTTGAAAAPATSVGGTSQPVVGGANPQGSSSSTSPSGGNQAGGGAAAGTGAAAAQAASKALANAPGTAAAASSAASPFGISLKLKYVHQDELKTVEFEFNQMNAVQRVYSPQGYFGLLLQGIDQSKHFLKIDGTDKFFNQFAVTINPPKDFTGIGLLSAHVALDYGDPSADVKHGEFVFDSTHMGQQVWSVFQGLIQQTQYTCTADYKFDPESGWQGEQLSYTLPAVTTENRVLNLDPYAFLGFLQIAITPGRINPDLVDRIDVNLQYTAHSGWQAATTITVRPGSTPQSWKLRLADKNDNSYTYTTVCYLKDGTVINGPLTTSTATAIVVSDPFIGAIKLTLQPAFDPSAFKLAIVELAYQDNAHNYTFGQTYQFQTTSPAVNVTIPLMDRTVNQYQYRITLLSNSNQQSVGAYITATDPLVLVAPGA